VQTHFRNQRRRNREAGQHVRFGLRIREPNFQATVKEVCTLPMHRGDPASGCTGPKRSSGRQAAKAGRVPRRRECRRIREASRDHSGHPNRGQGIAPPFLRMCWNRSGQSQRRFADAMTQARHRYLDQITAQTRTQQDGEEIPRRLLQGAEASSSQLRAQLR
jgi:hypothetical protein